MRGWIFFIGSRQLTKHSGNILLVLAIAAGVLALVTVLSVMNGFQYDTIENLLQIDSFHFIMSNIPFNSDYRAKQRAIEAVDGVQSVLPFLEIFSLANAPNRSLVSVNIRAIPPNASEVDAGFARQVQIIHGEFDLSAQSVIVGTNLIRKLGLDIGDPLILYTHSGGRLVHTIRGVFRTGYREFDTSLLLVSIEDPRIFGESPAINLGIKLTSPNDDHLLEPLIWNAINQEPSNQEGLQLTSWRTSNRAVFAALRLEKMLLMFTLGIIFVVVGVNIYQSLKREVIRRSDEIAILKAMGGIATHVRAIFAFQGLLIGIIGSAFGMASGLFISNNINNLFAFAERSAHTVVNGINWLIQQLGGTATLTSIPSIYFFIPNIPNRALLHECIAIFLFGVLTAVVSTALSTWRVPHIHPCDILRSR